MTGAPTEPDVPPAPPTAETQAGVGDAAGRARPAPALLRLLAWGLGLMLVLQVLTIGLLAATGSLVGESPSPTAEARLALLRARLAVEHQQATLAQVLLSADPLLAATCQADAEDVERAFAALANGLPHDAPGQRARHWAALAHHHWRGWQDATATPFVDQLAATPGPERGRLLAAFDTGLARRTSLSVIDDLDAVETALAPHWDAVRDQLADRLHPLQAIGGLALLGSLLVAGLVLWLVHQRTVRPLAALSRHVDHVGRDAGAPTAPPGLDRHDIVGELARSIDALIRGLAFERRQGADLELARATLEAQRRQLSMINAALNEKTRRLEDQGSLERQQTTALEQAHAALAGHAEALERAGHFRSEFLANMSHELRTPLNGIVALARMLADDPEGHLTNDEVESAQAIESSGRHLLHMINSLLDLSRLEAGRLDASADEIALAGWLEAMAREQRILAQNRGIFFGLELSPRLPGLFSTDSTRLRQILHNLFDNALKFTRAGEIKLAVAPATTAPGASHLQHPDGVLFEVSDSGKGLPEGRIEQLFDAFDQGDADTHRHYGGTGLGLAISRRLARLLGGELTARNRADGGAVFALWLPPLPPRPTPPAAATVVVPAPGPEPTSEPGSGPALPALIFVGAATALARRLARLAVGRGLKAYQVPSESQLPPLPPGRAVVVRQTPTGLSFTGAQPGELPFKVSLDASDEALTGALLAVHPPLVADGVPDPTPSGTLSLPPLGA